jgi:hypothetical protein
MPKPRKSLTELAASGTLQKNLGRYQTRIASKITIAAPIGTAPRHLQAIEKSIWAEVTRSAPSGLLTKSDRLALEVLCRLVARTRTAEFKTSESNALLAVLGKFGLTPSDRLKMSLEPLPEPTVQTAEQKAWDELAELDD